MVAPSACDLSRELLMCVGCFCTIHLRCVPRLGLCRPISRVWFSSSWLEHKIAIVCAPPLVTAALRVDQR